jgi:hypothetical protein
VEFDTRDGILEMRHAIAVIVCLLALPALADEQRFPADPAGFTEFIMPSGNVACTFVPKGGTDTYLPRDGGPELACTRLEPTYVVAILGRQGAAERIDDSGEQGCCGRVGVLQYGNVWRKGPFSCWSQETGLICESTSGHGMELARKAVKVW